MGKFWPVAPTTITSICIIPMNLARIRNMRRVGDIPRTFIVLTGQLTVKCSVPFAVPMNFFSGALPTASKSQVAHQPPSPPCGPTSTVNSAGAWTGSTPQALMAPTSTPARKRRTSYSSLQETTTEMSTSTATPAERGTQPLRTEGIVNMSRGSHLRVIRAN